MFILVQPVSVHYKPEAGHARPLEGAQGKAGGQ